MATPGERITWIRQISDDLDGRTWTDEEMVLGEFGIPDDHRGGERTEIRIRRLHRANDQSLEALWRFVAGLGSSGQMPNLASASTPDLVRLWGEGSPRIFVSHRADFKAQAKQLKDELTKWGATSFVAHDDIEANRPWQTEIERALRSMDVLVAVLSNGFAMSWLTNQEVGVALGRGIPVLCVRIEEDPHGFIGVPQAIPGAGRSPNEIAKTLIAVMAAQTQLSNALMEGAVLRWESARSFEEGIRAISQLEAFRSMPAELLNRIELAYDANDQLHGSTGVNNRYPGLLARIRAAAEQEM